MRLERDSLRLTQLQQEAAKKQVDSEWSGEASAEKLDQQRAEEREQLMNLPRTVNLDAGQDADLNNFIEQADD